MKEIINRSDLKYETIKYFFDFQQFKIITSLSDSIFNGKITVSGANKKQSNLMSSVIDFYSKVRPRSKLDQKKT